jgi:hypothetical protein
MFGGKSPSGVGFQVVLECSSFFTLSESDYCFDSPGAVFCGVWDFSGIVGLKTRFQILGKSGVMMGTLCFADKYVDVMKAHTEVYAGYRLRITTTE